MPYALASPMSVEFYESIKVAEIFLLCSSLYLVGFSLLVDLNMISVNFSVLSRLTCLLLQELERATKIEFLDRQVKVLQDIDAAMFRDDGLQFILPAVLLFP